MLYLTIPTLWLSVAAAAVVLPRAGYKIPSTSFDSQAAFDAKWAYNYPWGTTHNGAARMNQTHVTVGGGQLTLTADHVSGQAPLSNGSPINYLSGTVYAKEIFTIKKGGGYDFTGKFLAPTGRGTWPAIWLTGYTSWPPEIDLAEWKGSGKVSFNTLGVSGAAWVAKDVAYPNASSWHDIVVQVRDGNGVDAAIKFYLDGALQATQSGKGMVGLPFWLILDLQMEGSSGSPGPTSQTIFAAKNFSVYSYNP